MRLPNHFYTVSIVHDTIQNCIRSGFFPDDIMPLCCGYLGRIAEHARLVAWRRGNIALSDASASGNEDVLEFINKRAFRRVVHQVLFQVAFYGKVHLFDVAL